MADKKWRLGYGDEDRILSSIESGLLDGSDLIITKDTHRVAFVRPNDKTVLFAKSHLDSFDTVSAATEYALTDKSAYAGELISVLVDGKYKTYRLQPEESGYSIEDVDNASSIKQTVQFVDTFPESGQEEGVIYVVGTTGKIWTGSKWKTVFEDITTITEELKQYVQDLVSGLVSSAPGVVDESNPLPTEGYKAGQTWRVAVGGTYAGQKCEPGDLIICAVDYAETTASDSDFIVVQANVDGAVTGTEASVDGEIVLFSGVSGKVLKNSGINIEALSDSILKAHEHANKEKLDSFTKTQDELFADVDEKVAELKNEIEDRLIHTEPYINENNLIANGYGIIIEGIDEEINKVTYFMSGIQKSIEFPVGYNIVGGSMDDNCHSSSIVMNSGDVHLIIGGSKGDGNVAETNIVINGGKVDSILGGGYPGLKTTEKANHVGKATIVINGLDEKIDQVFGGGFAYASVGCSEIIVNDGAINYLTSGGSNGFTANGNIKVHGGSVDVLQSVNRGVVGAADITVDGGNVTSMYAGVEPDQGEVITTATGTFGHATLHLLGGTIEGLFVGVNNSVNGFDPTGFVSGEYSDEVTLVESQAIALGLKKVENSFTDKDAIDKAKEEAINTSKEYTDALMTLTEF